MRNGKDEHSHNIDLKKKQQKDLQNLKPRNVDQFCFAGGFNPALT